MSEFCKECYIKYFSPSDEDISRIIMSDDDDLDLCEGCEEWKPVVVKLAKKTEV